MGAGAPRSRDEALPNLLADVLRGDSVEPELLLRYADDPASLRAEERDRVEAGLRESPQLRDQLRVLRGFDLAGAVGAPARIAAAEPEARRPRRRSLLARLAELLRGRAGMVLVPLGAAAVLALVLMRQSETQPLTPTPGAAPPGPVAQVEPPEARPMPEPAPTAPAPQATHEPELPAEPVRPEPAPSAVAQAPKPPTPPAAEKPPAAEELDYIAMAEPVYVRPFGVQEVDEGRTFVRAPGSGISLRALAPPHVARTVSASPVLYWSLSELPRGAASVRLTIGTDDAAEPLIEKSLPIPTTAGTQRVALADLGAQLPLGVPLRWTIALRLDPENPSKDALTSAWIERVPETPELAAKLTAAKPLDRASVYAAAGLWYEALAELQAVVRAAPEHEKPRVLLAKLLAGAGLEGERGNGP